MRFLPTTVSISKSLDNRGLNLNRFKLCGYTIIQVFSNFGLNSYIFIEWPTWQKQCCKVKFNFKILVSILDAMNGEIAAKVVCICERYNHHSLFSFTSSMNAKSVSSKTLCSNIFAQLPDLQTSFKPFSSMKIYIIGLPLSSMNWFKVKFCKK